MILSKQEGTAAAGFRSPFAVGIAALCVSLSACAMRGSANGQSDLLEDIVPKRGEIGKAVSRGMANENVRAFDVLEFDVLTNQKWDRLSESHTDDVIVTYPDGTETKGIQKHIDSLKFLFGYAPDTSIKVHPIRIGNGNWTSVTSIVTGTFTRPMTLPNGTVIQPTGKKYSLRVATIGHWKNGKMDHEWLYWDSKDYFAQLGIGK